MRRVMGEGVPLIPTNEGVATMPVSVATMDDLVALTARVAALEGRGPLLSVQARRIADMVEAFGVNTFSSADAAANVWGSWPADYSAPTVIAALNWLTAGSGFNLRGREYHYAGRETMQGPWLKAVTAATGARFSMCVGANGGTGDVVSMLALASDPANGIAWLEGSNEPNTDFGNGMLPAATPVAVQAAVFAGAPAKAIGPSIVFGLPNPEGWITGYVPQASLGTMAKQMAWSNGHLYPPTMPLIDDGSRRGGSMDDAAVGLSLAYLARPVMLTEYHPTLYSAIGLKPGGAIDGYYLLLALLTAARLGIAGLWWYALFDYGSVYACGLFPKDATAPRPAATAFRNLCMITGDHGATKRTFTPGALSYAVGGLPPAINSASPRSGGQHMLFQASDGRFVIALFNAQVSMGGVSTPVTITFGTPPTLATEYNPLVGVSPVQQLARPSALTSQLDASVRLIVVVP
jgi:hypothetical protein